MKIVYKVDDVWLCQYGHDPRLLTILEVSGDYIRHTYAWESGVEFHKRALSKYGTVRRILGIPIGIKKT